MKLRSLLILVAALAFIACSKSDKDKQGGEAKGPPQAGKAPAAAAAPFTGTLDEGRLQAAKDGVKPFMKWDAANAHLVATVGAPHATEGSKNYWYLLDGDKCHELEVENANGEVGAVGLGVYDKAMKSKYDKCLAHDGDGEPAAAAGGGTAPLKTKAAKKAVKKADDKDNDDDDDDDKGGW